MNPGNIHEFGRIAITSYIALNVDGSFRLFVISSERPGIKRPHQSICATCLIVITMNSYLEAILTFKLSEHFDEHGNQ